MRKYIYKLKEKFDGSFELQRWVAKGTYHVFDKIISETDKDYNDWGETPETLPFTESDRLNYNANQKKLREQEYRQTTDVLLFKAFELSGTEREDALINYNNQKNEIRNKYKYL